MYLILFSCSSIHEYLDYFHFHLLAIVKNTAMNMDIQIPLGYPAFYSFG
jgi:hypothetical protein